MNILADTKRDDESSDKHDDNDELKLTEEQMAHIVGHLQDGQPSEALVCLAHMFGFQIYAVLEPLTAEPLSDPTNVRGLLFAADRDELLAILSHSRSYTISLFTKQDAHDDNAPAERVM